MKIIVPILALCLTLLFSACTANQTEAPSEEEAATIDTTTEDASPSSSEETDLNIEYEHVSYDTSFDWASTLYEGSLYSFDVPEDWTAVDGDSQGLVNGVFLVPPETDIDNFSFGCHMAIEFYDEPYSTQGDLSYYASEDFCNNFFAMKSIELSKLSALTKLDFYMWELENMCVYIAEYQRSSDTLVMNTTAYYVIAPDCYFVVYATTFGEDSEIPVQEAARYLIDTFVLS